jgi:hypothetical protein
METFDPVLLSGLVGEMDDLYEELRANQKIYHLIPRMLQGSVKSVVFSAVDQITFDPDILIITADVAQAEVLLPTGSSWAGTASSKGSKPWKPGYPRITPPTWSGESRLVNRRVAST